MAETSGFFNSQVDGEGIHDRVYLAGDFANYFSSLIGNGIFGGRLNELQIIAGTGNNVIMKSGRAFINGYWYENSTDILLYAPPNTAQQMKYFHICLSLDMSARAIRRVLYFNTSNTHTPTRNTSTYEIVLACVQIAPGATTIRQSDIIDYRFDDIYCGLVKGLIEQIDTSEFATQLDGFIQEVRERTAALEEALNSDIYSITHDEPAMFKSVYDPDNDGLIDHAEAGIAENKAKIEEIEDTQNNDIIPLLSGSLAKTGQQATISNVYKKYLLNQAKWKSGTSLCVDKLGGVVTLYGQFKLSSAWASGKYQIANIAKLLYDTNSPTEKQLKECLPRAHYTYSCIATSNLKTGFLEIDNATGIISAAIPAMEADQTFFFTTTYVANEAPDPR